MNPASLTGYPWIIPLAVVFILAVAWVTGWWFDRQEAAADADEHRRTTRDRKTGRKAL